VRLSDPLNERQLAVLRWIADGCPDGVMDGHAFKVTARALHDRKLVAVSKHGGAWQATVTERGEFYLEHGRLPVDGAARPSSTYRPRVAATRSVPPGSRKPANEPARSIDPNELLAQLLDGDGSVTIADPPPAVRAAWRRAIDAAKRSGQIPAEHYIWHRGRDRGDLVIELRQGRHPEMARQRSRPDGIAVPEDVADWHPAATADFRNVSAGSVRRARFIAHALATAASLQGLEVGAAEGPYALTFRAAGQLCGVRFYEEFETRDVLPDPDAPGSGGRYSWQRVQPETREVPSGRLVVEFDEDWHLRGRRRRFADRQRWRLDNKLCDVLAEVVFRLNDQRERREAAERAERDKQQAWRAAMAQARFDFEDSRRIEALDRQVAGWEKAQRIRSYCDVLGAVRDEHDEERTAWVAWARDYADRLDPRGRCDLAPAEVEPRPHQLAPFLKGWSAYEAKRL
jgi:hypothetical protein